MARSSAPSTKQPAGPAFVFALYFATMVGLWGWLHPIACHSQFLNAQSHKNFKDTKLSCACVEQEGRRSRFIG
eukprot:4459717-Amphidinium_carterae.1